jgi:hypothetical protein
MQTEAALSTSSTELKLLVIHPHNQPNSQTTRDESGAAEE